MFPHSYRQIAGSYIYIYPHSYRQRPGIVVGASTAVADLRALGVPAAFALTGPTELLQSDVHRDDARRRVSRRRERGADPLPAAKARQFHPYRTLR